MIDYKILFNEDIEFIKQQLGLEIVSKCECKQIGRYNFFWKWENNNTQIILHNSPYSMDYSVFPSSPNNLTNYPASKIELLNNLKLILNDRL